MFKKFKLRGNVSVHIRSDEEMASIDKHAADLFFKEQKKKLELNLKNREM